MIDLYEGFWTREEVAKDTDRYYIFGDNLQKVGMGGQAIIRGLPNAFGVPTKKNPSMNEKDFFSDENLWFNISVIAQAISHIPTDKPWVISSAGLGTGLSQLPFRAPLTFEALEFLIGLAAKSEG